MKKKGALFYIIDALVAAAIIVVTITIIFGTKIEVQDSTVAETAISNYITILSSKKIISLIEEPVTRELVLTRRITNPSATVFEAAVELVEKGLITNATNLMAEVSDIVLASQYSMRVSVIDGLDETIIFQKTIRDKNKAKIDLSRQQAISFKQNQFVETSTEEIFSGRTGDETCAPAICSYITNSSMEPYNSTTEPYIFDINGCATSRVNWFAHCRFESPTALVGPLLIEVELWV